MAISDPIRKQLEAQERIADEAHAALTAADDALAEAEARERRRATRRPSQGTMAAQVAAARGRM
jgi:hypothetical protein